MIEPQDGDLESFWARAIITAKLNPIDAVGGQTDLVSLLPGAFAFGSTREEATRLAELVISGKKRATTSYAAAYERDEESFPTPDDLWIMCDGEGHPRALLRNTEVTLVPFNEVDSEIASAEGEGNLQAWRADHEKRFVDEGHELGYQFDPSGDVVVEYFKVLYAR